MTLGILQWKRSPRYHPDLRIGSQGEDGEHLRDRSGWPFSIYIEAAEIGATDAVLCDGIQNEADAEELLRRINAAE